MPSIDLRPRKPHPKARRKFKGPPKPMPFDVALRKFRKACDRAGIVQEVRKREGRTAVPEWQGARLGDDAAPRRRARL